MCFGWSVITMAQGEWDEVVVFRIIFRDTKKKKEEKKKQELCWKPQNEETTASVQTSITNRDLF